MKACVRVVLTLWAVCVLGSLAIAGPLTEIYICPGYIALSLYTQQQFKVFGVDSDGNEVELTDTVTWQLDPAAGSITSSGLFTAGGIAGIFVDKLTAGTPDGLTAVASVEIVAPVIEGGYVFERAWGNRAAGQFRRPNGIARDTAGNFYVADTGHHRIQKFDPSGKYILQWGSFGSGIGQFSFPWSVAVDASGNVYVADSGNNRIQKFDSSGNYLTKWGCESPSAVTADAAGNVYAVEILSCRVRKFTSIGMPLVTWGSKGNGAGQFMYPWGIATDPDNNVYVADTQNDRIQKFDSSGRFITMWGSYGTDAGQFRSPVAVTVDKTYRDIYVADSLNQRIQRFDAAGTYNSAWGGSGSWLGNVRAMAVEVVTNPESGASTAFVYMADRGDSSVRKFDWDRGTSIKWESRVKGRLNSPHGIASDSSGNIYVADTGNDRVQKFDRFGNYVTGWSTANISFFGRPFDIAIGSGGTVYLTDPSTYVGWDRAVLMFDPSGSYLGYIGPYGTEDGQFKGAGALTVDDSGNLYVVDGGNARVQKLDPSGDFLAKWGWSYGAGDGQFLNAPRGIAVDRAGNIYLTDERSYRVQKFDSSGHLITMWGLYGTGIGQFEMPTGVSLDSRGDVYVADYLGACVQKFSPSGEFLAKLGSQSSGLPGQFYTPSYLTLDQEDNLFVVESDGSRIQKFVPVSSSSGKAKGAEDGQLVALSDQVVTAGTSLLGDSFYMESPDRSSGIKVTGKSGSRGSKVTVVGVLTTVNGERAMKASLVTVSGFGSLQPIGMNNAAIGGGRNGNQQATWGWRWVHYKDRAPEYKWVELSGLSNIGLLILTWGRVVSVDAGSHTFLINDGLGPEPSSVKCLAPASAVLPAKGDYVVVTGISSTELNDRGYLVPLVRVLRVQQSAHTSDDTAGN